MAEDFELANTLLASIDTTHYDELARFLQKQGFVAVLIVGNQIG